MRQVFWKEGAQGEGGFGEVDLWSRHGRGGARARRYGVDALAVSRTERVEKREAEAL